MSALATLTQSVEEVEQRRKSLKEARSNSEAELRKIVDGLTNATGETRNPTSEEERRSGELCTEIDEKDAALKELRKELRQLDMRLNEEKDAQRRARMLNEARNELGNLGGGDAQVTNEPMVYGPESVHSYVNDLVRWLGGPTWPGHGAAGERIAQWSHQVEREIALNDKTKRSQGALIQIREFLRGEKRTERLENDLREVRERGRASLEEKRTGIATGGGATASAGGGGGAAFVTPVFFVSDYAPYREFGRSFINQCNGQPLPPYGMNVYMPHVTRGVKVESQTEGQGVAEQTPEAGYISGALETLAGEVIVSQQLLDRAGPDFSFDRLTFDQLNRRYALEADTYVLKEVLAVGTEQSWEGNSNKFDLFAKEASGGFFGQIGKAKASIRTTAGTVLNPTHLFTHADRWEYISGYTDANGRPLILPDYAGVFQAVAGGNANGDVGIEGNTGYRFNGLPVFTDQNIPTKGTTGRDQAIVGDLQEVYVYEGNLVPRVIPQTYAQNLQVLLQLYAYITVIIRYSAGVVAISGTGMSSIAYEH